MHEYALAMAVVVAEVETKKRLCFLYFFTIFSSIIWIFRVSREAALAADLITA